jgi:BolA family transcriptional regulator, general stress-responsive regulator
MKRYLRIKQILDVLKPHYLEINDQTHLHSKHSSGLETHFEIKISADLLKEKKLLEQHKIINDLLREEFNNGLHAISIKIINP